MKMNELSKEQLMLLNTEFPADIEKQAEAIVNQEMQKVAELEEVATGCYNYGAELAMAKIAEMEAKHEAKETEEEETEEESSEKKAEADAMGNFILEGYWNTMMEKGAEFYGDKDIYLEELCKEAGLDKIAVSLEGVKNWAKRNNPFSAAAIGAKKANKAKESIFQHSKDPNKAKALSPEKKKELANKASEGLSKRSLGQKATGARAEAERNKKIGIGVGAGVGGAALGFGAGRLSKKEKND